MINCWFNPRLKISVLEPVVDSYTALITPYLYNYITCFVCGIYSKHASSNTVIGTNHVCMNDGFMNIKNSIYIYVTIIYYCHDIYNI